VLLWILTTTLLLVVNACEKNFDGIDPELRTNFKVECEDCDILFIGSSYLSIAGNDVVNIFDEFTRAAQMDINVERRDIHGWRLSNHAQSQETIDKIRERKWDYIILQGNSAFISQEKWHPYVIPYLKELKSITKSNSPKTCIIYMMPWAYLDGLTWIEGETDDYEQMQKNIYRESIEVARDLDIAIAPAGWTWYTAIENNYGGELYLNDNNHQSKAGAYLTACVFYSTIFEKPAPGITFSWTEEDDPDFLHEIAYQTVIDDLDLWNIYR